MNPPKIVFTLFQSTLPAGGATGTTLLDMNFTKEFQSTLPAGGATRLPAFFVDTVRISIHAPRGGSDDGTTIPATSVEDFNPRSPRGERRCVKG